MTVKRGNPMHIIKDPPKRLFFIECYTKVRRTLDENRSGFICIMRLNCRIQITLSDSSFNAANVKLSATVAKTAKNMIGASTD